MFEPPEYIPEPPTKEPETNLAEKFATVRNTKPLPWQIPDMWGGGPPVQDSEDLQRILALPRRKPPSEAEQKAMAEIMTARLLRPRAEGSCKCHTWKRPCIKELNEVQGWALTELSQPDHDGRHGILGGIGVGKGKTILALLSPMVTNWRNIALLVPPTLIPQLIRDYEALSEHFSVPSIVVPKSGKTKPFSAYPPGRPTIHVLPYSKLSRAEATAYLATLKPDAVIADECFPGETLITTPNGNVRIDALKVGDAVIAFDYNKNTAVVSKVVRVLQRKPPSQLVKVIHNNGEFICTPNHKIWTEIGYVQASNLNSDRQMRFMSESFSDLSGVQSNILDEIERQNYSEILPGGVRGELSNQDVRSKPERSPKQPQIGTSNKSQPDTFSWCSGTNDGKNEGSNVLIQGRERETNKTSTSFSGENRLTYGVGDPYQRCYGGEFADILQGRLSMPGGETSDRSGRTDSHQQEMEVSGQEKDRGVRVSRVVSVTILESRSIDRNGQSYYGNPVYDLEVENQHNYFANGILVSNCHKMRNADAVGTGRFLALYAQLPRTDHLPQSGSLTARWLADYAHLSGLSLRENSPLPLDPGVVSDWDRVLGAVDEPADMGALAQLCQPGEDVGAAFQRRLRETPRVIITDSPGCNASLVLMDRPVEIPSAVAEAIERVLSEWVRPDGEEFVERLQVDECASQLASGFYYRHKFPRMEPSALIEEWRAKRKDWHKELRAMMQGERRPHLDSPLLLKQAAIRYYNTGYKGELPTWKSECWIPWRDIMDKVQPEQEVCWIDDFLVEDAAEWGRKHRGVIWTAYTAFEAKLAELGGFRRYGAGSGESILKEKGDRSIIASIKAHGTGRDGLQYLFNEQYVVEFPDNGAELEQLLGRLHRVGQSQPEVTAYFARHTEDRRKMLTKALRDAKYVNEKFGAPRQLLIADVGFEL